MKLVNFRITFLAFFLVTLFALNFSIVFISQSAEIQSKELIKLQTRSKVTQKFILIKPNNPTASVVLFEGGSGILKLGSAFGKPTINQKNTSGIISHRDEFAKHNIMAAVVDTPSDHKSKKGMTPEFRISQDHIKDIEAIITKMKKEADVPVWLVGLSRGCFSALIGSEQLKNMVEGVIILSCPTVYPEKAKIYKTHPNAILNMELDKVTAPVQIIYHEKDECKWCPPANAKNIKEALVNSEAVQLKFLSGGKSPKTKCKARSAHSFYGIEEELIASIAQFIESHSK